MQILLYTPVVTSRIRYIFNFIFKDILKTELNFTTTANEFITYDGPKLSYADKPFGNEPFFERSPFLLSQKTDPVTIKKVMFGDQKVPFPVGSGLLPFDLFAASFYFITRYEEYLVFEGDEHLRFPAKLSLQYELDLLQQPVIDEWALLLRKILLEHDSRMEFGKREFSIVPTIDIERAFYYKSNGLFKNARRFLNAALQLDKERVLGLVNAGLGRHADPFDTYKYLHRRHTEYGLEPVFFFLLARERNNRYDVNIHPEDRAYRSLIRKTAKHAAVGIHPSYSSNNKESKIAEEMSVLEQIIEEKPVNSRQHFLRLHLPQTYLKLLRAGIRNDYSMGYASATGFRAGTCTPFFWYDLQLEKESNLKVHPFAVMDLALRDYLKLDPDAAIDHIRLLIDRVKAVGGTFCMLWHNESVSENRKWKGWKKVYDAILAYAGNMINQKPANGLQSQ
ncbi:polysaccharide deacetylase family protein [Pedobacter sp. SYP-B3415]|uniref:polysaccharide deacetylase family protein n=1 Tax=Pedobacter sp. SYP-B3415 TaxID=2496641 RepID=UPI00101BFD22|nr:polysaccharide deacetylase family protein [Pedobacter sp. SYP-B3415]